MITSDYWDYWEDFFINTTALKISVLINFKTYIHTADNITEKISTNFSYKCKRL